MGWPDRGLLLPARWVGIGAARWRAVAVAAVTVRRGQSAQLPRVEALAPRKRTRDAGMRASKWPPVLGDASREGTCAFSIFGLQRDPFHRTLGLERGSGPCDGGLT